MIILSALGCALACYSAINLARLFRMHQRAERVDEPAALAAATGLIMLGWVLSAAAGAALSAFAMTSQIPR
jgi:hypothetical protein